MKRIIFEATGNPVQFPDDMILFSNIDSVVKNKITYIIADYSGSLEFEEYLEDFKIEKIAQLHAKYQKFYSDYLAQYPQREVDSFATKQAEATAWRADNAVATPMVSAMVGGDETKRIELLNAILAKIDSLAFQEGEMLAKRDAIKSCSTLEELNSIEI